MRRFVIERQYLLPVYEHILVEAASLAEAYRRALDDVAEPWGGNAETDYESARPTTIVRAVELPEQIPADKADDRSLSSFLYDRGLDPLPIPPEFDEVDGCSGSVGFA